MKRSECFAVICAAVMSAALFAGCKPADGGNGEVTSGSAASVQDNGNESTNTTVYLGEEEDLYAEINTETRPIAEGDDFAINKINNKSPADALPGGYVLLDYTEQNQGKLFMGEKSKIVIRAYNYNEDLQAMDIWADNACALIKIGNITSAQDTVYEEPENVKVCGFDGIRYDYQMIQYDFIPDENDPDAEPVKTELYRFNARAYFFYSEQDAYIIMFDTLEEDWDEQVKLFEEFVADLEVTKTDY